MDLKIVSINVNGFRSKFKQDSIKDFATKNNVDILLLQETFIDNITLAKSIEQNFELNERCIWNFAKADSSGVAIFLFNKNICIDHFHTDIYGRVIRLDFSLDGFPNFRIVNAYFPSDPTERLEFINNFSQYLCGARNLIIGGDFNFVLDTKLDKIGGNLEKGMIGSKPFKTIIEKFNLIDCFRYLYPKKKMVTWMRKNVATGNETINYEIVGTRLDRLYISSILKDTIVNFETSPCSSSDHDFIILTLKSQGGVSFGKSYWKFNDDLLHDETFCTAFEFFWKIISRSENIDLTWWDKMKATIKRFCIDFSKSKNKKLYGELKSLKTQYNSLNVARESDLKLLDDIKSRVKTIESSLLKGTIIRSKVRNIETNENPTSYFFQREVVKSKSKTVKSVTCNNISYTNSCDILSCFKSFYENLYENEPVDKSLNDSFLNNLPQVDNTDNLFLEKPIEKTEILQALRDMQPNKSPGSDGFSSSFYLKFFHLLGDTLCKIINIAYDKGEMSLTQRLSYITLICKDETRADEMKCYRPISLLNVDYKIISKIIATRLGKILPKIIDINQTSGIKGRSIFDNLHLIRNVIDYIDQKDLAACFICVDQEKAFDRVSWSYMFDTLNAFGFSENFIKWIKLLYTDISSSVIVNNYISDAFPIKRGVRQGCSLSLLLYVLCFEPFANKIRNLDGIKGLQIPGTKKELRQTLYADDGTAILTSELSIQTYFYWVERFGKISGSKVNYDKTRGIFLGKWKTRSDHPFGISWVKSHKILGYHFGYGNSTDETWAKVFSNFDKTLNLWRTRRLSLKGKSTVLNSLGLSKILYYATAAELPSHYETLLERSAFKFIWESKFEPVARKTCYLEFLNGGLNVPNFRLKFEALQLVHMQKLICNHDAYWTYFARYWIGLQLRKYNSSFSNNTIPHSEYIPHFYRSCLETFKKITAINSDVTFGNKTCKYFYNTLLDACTERPKCEKIFPQIDFKTVWKNLYNSCIDPDVRNVSWKICHDVLYVNYFLFNKNISKDKFCPLCGNVETVSHLFLECKFVKPLVKIILSFLRELSANQIKFSEYVFKFSLLPQIPKLEREICLILLSEFRYAIWINRNLKKHENKNVTPYNLTFQFLNKIKFRILIDRSRLSIESFINRWCKSDLFCKLDITNNVVFADTLDINNHFKPQKS